MYAPALGVVTKMLTKRKEWADNYERLNTNYPWSKPYNTDSWSMMWSETVGLTTRPV